MTPKIECQRDNLELRILINGLLHFQIMMNQWDGMQSYYDGKKSKIFSIEIYRKQGDPIVLEYVDRETWVAVLQLLAENI
jgi:hypothetical protein